MASDRFTIRRATASDKLAIWKNRTRAIRELCGTHYAPSVVKAWASAKMPPDFDTVIRDQYFLVGEHSGGIVAQGFLDVETPEISALFVSPDYVRRGFGQKILTNLEEEAKARRIDRLFLSATLNAVSFYINAGYVRIRDSVFHHPDGFSMACIEMEKQV